MTPGSASASSPEDVYKRPSGEDLYNMHRAIVAEQQQFELQSRSAQSSKSTANDIGVPTKEFNPAARARGTRVMTHSVTETEFSRTVDSGKTLGRVSASASVAARTAAQDLVDSLRMEGQHSAEESQSHAAPSMSHMQRSLMRADASVSVARDS